MFFGHNYQIIAPYINTKLPLAGLSLLGVYLAYVYLRKFFRSRVKNQL
jgi:hypothetical protein